MKKIEFEFRITVTGKFDHSKKRAKTKQKMGWEYVFEIEREGMCIIMCALLLLYLMNSKAFKERSAAHKVIVFCILPWMKYSVVETTLPCDEFVRICFIFMQCTMLLKFMTYINHRLIILMWITFMITGTLQVSGIILLVGICAAVFRLILRTRVPAPVHPVGLIYQHRSLIYEVEHENCIESIREIPVHHLIPKRFRV